METTADYQANITIGKNLFTAIFGPRHKELFAYAMNPPDSMVVTPTLHAEVRQALAEARAITEYLKHVDGACGWANAFGLPICSK